MTKCVCEWVTKHRVKTWARYSRGLADGLTSCGNIFRDDCAGANESTISIRYRARLKCRAVGRLFKGRPIGDVALIGAGAVVTKRHVPHEVKPSATLLE